MKRTLIALLAPLFMTAMPALADTVVESNYTVALKFYINDKSEVINAAGSSLAYSTVSIKNADILYSWSEANDIPLSKKARLMRRDFVDTEGDADYSETEYFIRDGEVDHPLGDSISWDDYERAVKYKRNQKGTGSLNEMNYSNIEIVVNWEGGDDDYMSCTGLQKFTCRYVAFKDEITSLDSSTAAVAGYAYFYTSKRDWRYSGVVQGTVKQSGAKAFLLLN